MKNRRVISVLAAAVIVTSATNALQGQGQSQVESKTRLAFEVATVKPSPAGERGGGIRPLPGGQTYIANNVPLRVMIALMYHVTDSQISGGPDWINIERYNVEAKAEHPANLEQLHEMFQTLLTDRFKLRFHRETKELPAYVLTVDRSGAKLKLNESLEQFEIPVKGPPGKMIGERVSMSHLSWILAQLLNRPVVDKTGLDRYYDFTLEWSPELPPGLAAADSRETPPDRNGPTIFTALREQLGLKLDSQKGPVEVFVIDHVERPTSN